MDNTNIPESFPTVTVETSIPSLPVPSVPALIRNARSSTAYLSIGCSLDHAQFIACRESASTELYDHMSNTISLDEIERISI